MLRILLISIGLITVLGVGMCDDAANNANPANPANTAANRGAVANANPVNSANTGLNPAGNSSVSNAGRAPGQPPGVQVPPPAGGTPDFGDANAR